VRRRRRATVSPSTTRTTEPATVVEAKMMSTRAQLLEVFMRHPAQLLTRYQLLEGAWDNGYEHRSNVIDV
jgi:DNA-binding response OmpR family regulator